jgi:predicted PurR-regulated permease PerM
MNDINGTGDFDRKFVQNMIESALRIGLIFILLFWSYDIIRPFIIPIIWGGIIAIAAMPLVNWLEKKFGGRRGLAVTLFTLVGIMVLVVPFVLLIISVIEPIESLAVSVDEGTLQIPRPTERLAEIPLVGDQLYQSWMLASTNLEAFLTRIQPQLQEWTINLLATLGGGVTSVLMFIISLLIAAGFMVGAEGSAGVSKTIATRVLGEQGAEWVTMCTATVRSVLQGVIGVAVIQTVLVAIGLFAVGLPAAGVWTVGVLILAIAQVPPLILLLPIIIYVFSYADTTTAIIFTIWSVLAGASDTVLKPMLMGRGLDVPMPIILLGAIGGMIASGIIGLFMGAVILAVWYKLFQAWIKQQSHV